MRSIRFVPIFLARSDDPASSTHRQQPGSLPMAPRPPLSFIHLPKTGGSTLRWILDRQYRRFLYVIPQWFHEGAVTPVAALESSGGDGPDVVGAHRPYGPDLWPAGPALAMVRDPVKRVLSHVAHLRAEPEVWLPQPVPEASLPLADWIQRRPLALFDNDQVRYLSGAEEFDGMHMTRAMTEADLEKALTVVRGGALVAPMESFDEALLDWQHRLGWRPPYYQRVNVRRKRRDDIPRRDLEALEACNRLDRVLCEEVGVTFRQRLAETEHDLGEPLSVVLEAFRERNASAAVRLSLRAHTARRGLRHPLRAANMVTRTLRQRLQPGR